MINLMSISILYEFLLALSANFIIPSELSEP